MSDTVYPSCKISRTFIIYRRQRPLLSYAVVKLMIPPPVSAYMHFHVRLVRNILDHALNQPLLSAFPKFFDVEPF